MLEVAAADAGPKIQGKNAATALRMNSCDMRADVPVECKELSDWLPQIRAVPQVGSKGMYMSSPMSGCARGHDPVRAVLKSPRRSRASFESRTAEESRSGSGTCETLPIRGSARHSSGQSFDMRSAEESRGGTCDTLLPRGGGGGLRESGRHSRGQSFDMRSTVSFDIDMLKSVSFDLPESRGLPSLDYEENPCLHQGYCSKNSFCTCTSENMPSIVIPDDAGAEPFMENAYGVWNRASISQTDVLLVTLKVKMQCKCARMLLHEIVRAGRVCHPNILLQMDVYMMTGSIVVSCVRPAMGKLAHYVERERGFARGSRSAGLPKHLRSPKGRLCTWGIDLARALHFTHSLQPPILLRDLVSDDCLIDGDLRLVLADVPLRHAMDIQGLRPADPGLFQRSAYKAPELLVPDVRPTEACDVYSCGSILWYMYMGTHPEVPPDPLKAKDVALSQLLRKMWSEQPGWRPRAEIVRGMLESMRDAACRKQGCRVS